MDGHSLFILYITYFMYSFHQMKMSHDNWQLVPGIWCLIAGAHGRRFANATVVALPHLPLDKWKKIAVATWQLMPDSRRPRAPFR